MLWMSSGKPLMSVALSLLVQKNSLHWDDPISKFIPEFTGGGKEAMTLRHVLTHTCGLRHADRINGKSWDDIVRQINSLSMEPRWELGETGGYHTGGTWVLLGEVLRRLDGRMPDTFYRDEIFEPLGMKRSGLGGRYLRQALRVYDTSDGAAEPHSIYTTTDDMRIPRPGRNSWGTAGDLGKFYLEFRAALSGKGKLLEKATAGELVARQRVGIPDKTFGHPVDFGLGIYLNSQRYETEAKKISYGYGPDAGRSTFGHSGAQSSCGYYDPENDLVVVWITNGMPGEPRHQSRIRDVQGSIYLELGLASSRASQS
jgi:CubicO group peptidase (beta-lactamase class C family)